MRSRRTTPSDIAASLLAVKLLVQGMKDAMPTLQGELRRDACERIDDIISDLGSLKR
ncbi:hypothetical protein [Sphingobium aromaticiconvertens]|uniref:hypothetical protein n=1 Tax=Sphingobium aromaticiconvertens TaxID=365341 RepID=UPI00301ACE16